MKMPLWRRRQAEELEEELRAHLEAAIRARMERGESRAAAEAAARHEFGNVNLVRETTRDIWGWASFDRLMQDVRYGWRQLRRSPGFTAVAVLTLAAAIGASTVLFSFANGFLFRPLHAVNPHQMIQLFTSDFDGPLYGGSSYADYEDFREAPVFGGLLASMRAQAALSDAERTDMISGVLVSGNYFDVLGLRASHGRFFRAEENRTPGTHPVVVLSHDAWRRRFAADPAIAGRLIELNGQPFTVIGVGPPRFAGTSIELAADFFVPAMMQHVISPGAGPLPDRGQRTARILGRLKAGVTLPEADAALRVLAAKLFGHDPAAWRDRAGRARVITVLPEVAARFVGAPPGAVAEIYAGVMAAVAGLLAIACVNVATVLLAQATKRRKEIAVRLALGASRRRLVRQLLTECALLATAGGALGLLLAQWAAALFLRFRPDQAPPFDLTLDYRVLLFSLGASLITVVFFGLAPALQATRQDLHAELKGTARVIRVRGLRFGLRAGLVVVQIALSLALMTGAGLMLRSAHAGQAEDPGFRRKDVLSIGINLSAIPDRRDAHARFYQEAVRAAAALPAVERVALAALVPMDGSNSQVAIRIAEGGTLISTSPDINVVGAGYFALLDIPIKQGREFSAADHDSSLRVAVVNEAMARQFWNGDPVGKAFTEEKTNELIHIVGVVRDLRHRSFGEEPRPMVYFCAGQRSRPRMTLHVRTTAPPRVIAPSLQRVLHEVDRVAGLSPAETMDEYFARVTLPQRLGATAAMATAVLQLALAVMALYGVIAFAASQRTREIGVRMALGASHRSVITLIMHEGLLLTAVGVVFGVGIALLGAAPLRSMLIGIGPADPVSFGGAALVLLLVAAAAGYVPARRATRVDPMVALRHE